MTTTKIANNPTTTKDILQTLFLTIIITVTRIVIVSHRTRHILKPKDNVDHRGKRNTIIKTISKPPYILIRIIWASIRCIR